MRNTKIKSKRLYSKLKGGASASASRPRSSTRGKSKLSQNPSQKSVSKGKSRANEAQENEAQSAQSISFRELITSKSPVNAIINLKNIRLKCVIGADKLIVGNTDDVCIEIKYTPKHNFCTLEGFFYKVNKAICKSKSFLNNSRFIDNTKVNGRIPSDYNKKFNETMMELFDIININAGMEFCKLRDGSQLNGTKCGDIKMTILKHFERGYGFYNEFGFMYKDKIDKSNDFLKFINIEKRKPIDITNITPENINKLLISNGLPYEKVSDKTIEIFNTIIKANEGITYEQFINEIMNYCKMPRDALPTGLFADYQDEVSVTELTNLITIITHNLLGGSRYSLTQYKLYDKNLVSKLINKDNDETRQFSMVNMNMSKKYNIEINELVKADDNIFDLEINIGEL